LKKEIQDIKAEKDEQNQLIEKEISAKKECEKEIAHKNGVIAELEEQIRQLDAEHSDPADLERKNLELEELKKEVQNIKSEKDEQNKLMQEEFSARKECEKEIAKKDQILADLKEQICYLKAEHIDPADLERKNQQLEELKQGIQDIKAERDQQMQQMNEEFSARKECEKEITQKDRILAELEEQIRQLNAERIDPVDLKQKNNELEELKKEIQDIKAEKDEQNQLIEKEISAKKECEKEIAHKNGVIAELEEQIRQLDAEHSDPADLERKNLELEELKKEVQNIKSEKDEQNKLMQEEFSARKECEKEIAKKDQILADLKEQICYLKAEHIDPADLERKNQQLEELKQGIQDIKAERDQQMQQMNEEFSARKECEKEITQKDRILAELEEQIRQLNSERIDPVDLERKNNELEELKKEIQDIKAEKDEQNQLIEKEFSVRRECEKEISQKDRVLAELKEQICRLNAERIDPADLECKDVELDELKSATKLMAATLTELKVEKVHLETQLDEKNELERQFETAQFTVKDMEKKIKDNANQMEEYVQKIDRMEAKLVATTKEKSRIETELESSKAASELNIKEMEKKLKDASSIQMEEYVQKLHQIEAQLATTTEEKTRIEKELESFKDASENIKKLEKKIKIQKFTIDDYDETLRRVEAECDEIEAKLTQVTEEKTRLETDLETTRQKLSEVSCSLSITTNQTKQEDDNMDFSLQDVSRVQGASSNDNRSVRILEQHQQQTAMTALEQHNQHLGQEVAKLKAENRQSDHLQSRNAQLTDELTCLKEKVEKLSKENTELSHRLNDEAASAKDSAQASLKAELDRVRRELGKKNVEYASLKVDVDREQLDYQKLNKRLTDEVEYEKQVVARLTNKLRALQTEKMDTTILNPKANIKDMATNTESSPTWINESEKAKEIQLYRLEHKLRRYEKEMKTVTFDRDFYFTRGTEWKSRAIRYEETLTKQGIDFRKGADKPEDPFSTTTGVSAKENMRPTVTDQTPTTQNSCDEPFDELVLDLNRPSAPMRDMWLKAHEARDNKKKNNECPTQ